MYNIFIKKSAEKDLDKINEPFLSQIITHIEKLKKNPRNTNVKKLVNKINEYRLRAGNYWVLFYIEDKEKAIKISRVLHRKDSYR